MTARLLLVDYENVQALDVATIPADVRVHVVLGAKQKPVVEKVKVKLAPLGDRATVNRITTLAHNAATSALRTTWGKNWRSGRRPAASSFPRTRRDLTL